MKKIATLLLLFCACFQSNAQNHTTKGKEFWFSYMENLSLAFNGPPSFSIIVSSEVTTTGAIQVPSTGLSIPFSVTAMQDTEIVLPLGILYPQGDESTYHFGFRVVSNDSINLYVYHHRLYFSEATLVVPESELTSYYMITGQADDRVQTPSEMIIEATQDSTAIEITPSQITSSFRPPHVPYYINLNIGDVYQLQSYYNLAGTEIRSLDPSKKLAVFSGAQQSSLRCAGADDHLYDQNYMSMYGKDFVLVPMYNQGGDVLTVVSLEDSNYVSINYGTPFLISNKGDRVDTLVTNASYVTALKPISISQYNKSQSCNTSNLGDPCMVVIPPINLMKYRAIFRNDSAGPTATYGWFTNYYANIVVPAGTGANVTLDGVLVTGFHPLASNGAYLWTQLPLTKGSHEIYSPTGFNAFTYALGSFNAYAYHLGFDFDNTPVGLNEISNEPDVAVVPNPFSDITTLTITNVGLLRSSMLEVYSSDGKLVYEKPFGGNRVEMERGNLRNGIYFYMVRSENKLIASGKLAVQ